MIRANHRQGPSERHYTSWFDTESSHPISVPPPLHPSCGLQQGDLFLHRTPIEQQLWLRVSDEEHGETWKPVGPGYEREDGRKLTITPKMKIPSWVGRDWGARRV